MQRREKQVIQPNPAALYLRPQICHTLNKVWEYPLTVVEAPMGYGKTTAVKEWLQESGAHVLWQTVANASANEFWYLFARLFQQVSPLCAESLLELGVPTNSRFLETAVELASEVTFPPHTVIVLDDYHLLSSESLDRFFELLVKRAANHFHLVIISRTRFGENTTELALKGYCNVIGKQNLEFTHGEIIEYYKLCGIHLTTAEAAELYAYTEGWISALYLSMLSFLREGRLELRASLQELIEKVIYRQCTLEEQELLVTVCIFDSFSLEQAQFMWPQVNVPTMMQRLVANNALIRYDNLHNLYQMHNIFTGYLRELLKRQKWQRQQTIWCLAGKWYVKIRNYAQAMSCFYQAADFDQLLQVFEADKGSSIKKEHKETMIRYFEDCPPATKRAYPRAGLIYAMYLFIFNEVDRFAKQCADIGEYIDQMPEDAKREKAQLAGELEIMRGFAQYNRIDGMNAHHRKAAQLLQGTSNLIDRRASWTFGSPSVLCMYYRESGRLNEAVTAMARSMPDYYHLTDGHGFGAETVMRAERHFYVGDFENAEIAAHEALYAAQAKGQIAIELCALLLQMRLSLVKGNLATLVECLTHMRDEFQWQKRYHYIHTLDLCEGFIYSCLGWEKKIPNWIVKGDFADSHLFFPATAFFNIVWGKALLLSGQYGKLIGLSGSFLTVAAVSPNLLGAVYTHIFAAAAQYRLQLRAEGNDSLRQALDIAVPDELIMPFVENGEYIDAGLSILEQEGKYGGFIHRIRAVYAAYALNVASMRGADESDNPIAKLSAREMEVAELAATGLSNLHIAKQLGIESATVKKTLQNIYAKLAINSRTLLTKMIMEQKNR